MSGSTGERYSMEWGSQEQGCCEGSDMYIDETVSGDALLHWWGSNEELTKKKGRCEGEWLVSLANRSSTSTQMVVMRSSFTRYRYNKCYVGYQNLKHCDGLNSKFLSFHWELVAIDCKPEEIRRLSKYQTGRKRNHTDDPSPPASHY